MPLNEVYVSRCVALLVIYIHITLLRIVRPPPPRLKTSATFEAALRTYNENATTVRPPHSCPCPYSPHAGGLQPLVQVTTHAERHLLPSARRGRGGESLPISSARARVLIIIFLGGLLEFPMRRLQNVRRALDVFEDPY